MTKILETIIKQSPDHPDQKIIELIGDDGNHVSVSLEHAEVPGHSEVIARAGQLLAKISHLATASQSQTAKSGQPTGPVPPVDPLLKDYRPDGELIIPRGEGMIEPELDNNDNQEAEMQILNIVVMPGAPEGCSRIEFVGEGTESVVVTLKNPNGEDRETLIARAKAVLVQIAAFGETTEPVAGGRRTAGRAEDADTLNEQLDEGLEQSFPGSDPISVTNTSIPGQPKPM
jgi:hypothetical protein